MESQFVKFSWEQPRQIDFAAIKEAVRVAGYKLQKVYGEIRGKIVPDTKQGVSILTIQGTGQKFSCTTLIKAAGAAEINKSGTFLGEFKNWDQRPVFDDNAWPRKIAGQK